MTFINGLIFGLVLQLSIGPVCMAVLHLSISKGFREAFKMVLGVALVDGVYIAASLMGVGTLLNIYILKKIILWAGAGVLIYFGIKHFKSGIGTGETSEGRTGGGSFLHGIKLTLTNPLTIVFWSGIFGSMIASGTLHGMQETAAFSFGCVFATLIFLTAISFGGNLLSGFMKGKALKYLDYAVGLFLIGFGIYMSLK